MAAATDRAGEDLLLRVQDLQARLEDMGESEASVLAEELVSAVVQLYGAGLERIVVALRAAGEEGERIARALAEDPLVAPLLLIHDLHPVPLSERVQGALEQVRPYMESHGGNVELLSLQDGVASISLRGSCSDCAASAVTLELAIKQALEEAAPDLEELRVVEPDPPPAASGAELPMAGAPALGKVELPILLSTPAPAAEPAWFAVDHLDLVPVGKVVGTEVQGSQLVVANVDGTLLAYSDACAGCGGPLHGGELSAGALCCPGCGRSFFLPRAGRSLDDERLQLRPVPLLRERGGVQVAL
jgi:Fe-S cluster biogenesis protein NfuA/nitrite reductase/ring-hydroxylating ferredoxin subunit